MQTTPFARSFAALLTAASLAASPAAAQTLYSQANLVTNYGAGYAGANASATTGSYGTTVNASSNGFRVADNFSIASGSWTISSFRFFGYQNNSPSDLSSPFNFVGWQIWSGRPGDNGSSIVAGNIATNSLLYTGFSGIYRTPTSNLTDRTRPVMVVDAKAGGVTLGAGTYWLEWVLGTQTGNAFVPLLNGSNGNARSYNVNSGLWTSAGAELPFEILGAVPCNVVPEPSTYALMGTGLLGLVGMARRRRIAA